MVNIILKTIKGGEITPQDDAIIYQATVQSGIFDGCEVAVSNTNTLNITGGFGMVAGRYFRMTDSSIDVTLPLSENLKGRLYFHLDLQNAEDPLKLLVATGTSLAELQIDERVNITEGVYQMELASFDVTPTGIENLVEKHGGMNSISKELADVYKNVSEINNKLDGPISADIIYHIDVNSAVAKKVRQGMNAIEDAPVAPKDGWKCEGWGINNDPNTAILKTWIVTSAETRDLYAVYSQENRVTISFDAGEGEQSIDSKTGVVKILYCNGKNEADGAGIKSPEITSAQSGKILVGWECKDKGNEFKVDPGDFIPAKSDVTLHAIWMNSEKTTYYFSGGEETYVVPATGLYKLEAWGAKGTSSNTLYGRGGRSSGYALLKRGEILYVYVGGTNGFNGGGAAKNPGGGCTHIATTQGILAEFEEENAKSKVLIVAGGGGGQGGTTNIPGNGGGSTGGNGTTYDGNIAYGGGSQGTGKELFGKGEDISGNGSGGGGGGWYGGKVAKDNNNNSSVGGGGSGQVNLTPIAIDGQSYGISQSSNIQDGDGKAEITFIKFYKRGLK